jgi:hypothetical protein
LGSPTVLYCGADDCLRIPVLRAAGFRVASCDSVTELERRLEDEPEIAVVLFEEARGKPADAAPDLARERSTAALVLFRHPAGDSSEGKFDLVIDPATPPARWLQLVAEILLSRAGFSGATLGWPQIARDVQARRRDWPAENEGSVRSRGYGIQPEKRRYT